MTDKCEAFEYGKRLLEHARKPEHTEAAIVAHIARLAVDDIDALGGLPDGTR